MAVKKIRLDFSKVEERSGWNTRSMPEGLHKMKVESVQETEAQDGTDMLVYALVPVDPKYKSRRFPFYCKLQQNQLWKLRDLLVATGSTVPKKAISIDPNAPVGKLLAAEVEDETGQYEGRSSVNGTYGLDILDEDGSIADQDEDDEEYEGDEEADDSDEEDYEEEDEDEGEDLSTLTLPELRKLAKTLGVDTAGLKKDELIEAIEEAQAEEDEDDEDDLDDEDLEDEDLDEEEFEDDEEDEEPEPAPTRRRAAPAAKAAPARRAPAKAAAAPARRVVKRR